MKFRLLARHRDASIVCPGCQRHVPRKARQQQFCSERCRERGRSRVRKAFLGLDTGAPRNPPKNARGFNGLQAAQSGSTPRIIAPRAVIDAEIMRRRNWREVISVDGVRCQVCQLAGAV